MHYILSEYKGCYRSPLVMQGSELPTSTLFLLVLYVFLLFQSPHHIGTGDVTFTLWCYISAPDSISVLIVHCTMRHSQFTDFFKHYIFSIKIPYFLANICFRIYFHNFLNVSMYTMGVYLQITVFTQDSYIFQLPSIRKKWKCCMKAV